MSLCTMGSVCCLPSLGLGKQTKKGKEEGRRKKGFKSQRGWWWWWREKGNTKRADFVEVAAFKGPGIVAVSRCLDWQIPREGLDVCWVREWGCLAVLLKRAFGYKNRV